MKKTVLDYFEEIMKVPRESGKEEKIANYLVNYAKENNIEYHLGKYNTVFLKKNNNSDKTIILQAHSDMVCVSNDNYDFDNKGIPYYIDGDYYRSKNTSLGADDGIGLAIILAMLQEEDNMPNIEAIITTNEETNMLGAMNFDYSLVTGKTLISLDGIHEGDIESSCAGMVSITINKNISYKEDNTNKYKLTISGLAGGHSGDDINKGRCNAIKLAFKLLDVLSYDNIVDINIGTRDNVIPNEGYIVFTSNNSLDDFNQKLSNVKMDFCPEDEGITLNIKNYDGDKSIIESDEIYKFVSEIKDSLLETYKEDNFPLLSANIGKIETKDNELVIKYGIRSSDEDKQNELTKELELLANKYNFKVSMDVIKPFSSFKEDSNIRKLLQSTYKKLYNKDAVIRKIHACMEIGVLSNNISDIDICTIAPTISNCHSVNENVSISSTLRVYDWLKLTLNEYNKQE